MRIYTIFVQVFRYTIAIGILLSTVNYSQNIFLDTKVLEITKVIHGEYTIQLDKLDLKLALNDSTIVFMINV